LDPRKPCGNQMNNIYYKIFTIRDLLCKCQYTFLFTFSIASLRRFLAHHLKAIHANSIVQNVNISTNVWYINTATIHIGGKLAIGIVRRQTWWQSQPQINDQRVSVLVGCVEIYGLWCWGTNSWSYEWETDSYFSPELYSQFVTTGYHIVADCYNDKWPAWTPEIYLC
jgi:hypothetical protein